jgi:hypothetical protein
MSPRKSAAVITAATHVTATAMTAATTVAPTAATVTKG